MTVPSGDDGAARAKVRARALLVGDVSDIREVVRGLRGAPAFSRLSLIGALTNKTCASARIAGVRVRGRAEDLAQTRAWRGQAEILILATQPDCRTTARILLDQAVNAGMRVRIAKFGADGQVQLRPMALEDVIGAAGDGPDLDLVRSVITGRRVLVTGGAGSIGGELTRKLAALGPARLSVIDNSEFNIFQLEQELAALDGAPERSLRYADIRDSAAILRIVEAEQPDLIFHAAAMKHVPLVEQNPCEGVLTNVLGVRNVAEAAARVGAHFVFVSTDKAANPVSVMGATKRLGEIFCQALDREAPAGGPRRLTVRLGNVLGSAGSVAPLFEKQLAQGGPLTITHPDVARYFITISQAADCLLQAAAVGLADETRGAVFVLEMGEPVSVLHLAQDLIRLSGRRPEDIGVRVIGLRPGEKLREELIADDEVATPTISADVKAVSSAMVTLGDIALRFERVIAAARAGSDENVRRVVHAMIAPAHAARRAS